MRHQFHVQTSNRIIPFSEETTSRRANSNLLRQITTDYSAYQSWTLTFFMKLQFTEIKADQLFMEEDFSVFFFLGSHFNSRGKQMNFEEFCIKLFTLISYGPDISLNLLVCIIVYTYTRII